MRTLLVVVGTGLKFRNIKLSTPTNDNKKGILKRWNNILNQRLKDGNGIEAINVNNFNCSRI